MMIILYVLCTSHPLIILLIRDINERSFEPNQIKIVVFHLLWTNIDNSLWLEIKQWTIENKSTKLPYTVFNKDSNSSRYSKHISYVFTTVAVFIKDSVR